MNRLALPRVFAVLLGFTLGFLPLACVENEPNEIPQEVQRRVLLVGIDGATFRIIDPMIRSGHLPNLASIAKTGVSGKLRSHYPILSPRVWTSVATGKLPAKHGILNWVYKADDGSWELFQSSHRKAHALWNIATDAGLTVGMVNWLNTYPVEIINGIMISDAVAGQYHDRQVLFARKKREETEPARMEGTAFPTNWNARLEEIEKQTPLNAAVPNPYRGNSKLPIHAHPLVTTRAWDGDDLIARMALEVESEIKPDLLMLIMPGVDKISHFIWGAIDRAYEFPPELQFSEEESEAGKDALLATYAQADFLLGKLMERFSSDDLIVVVSDHGFESRVYSHSKTTGGHDTLAAIDGVFFARGADLPVGAIAEGLSVNDITPMILTWLGLPVAEDMDGSVPEFFDPNTVTTIPTYDLGTIPRIDLEAVAPQTDRIEELRSLGYIDEDGPRE